MSNKETGEVRIDIGGQVYRLTLDTNAMAELEGLFSTKDRELLFPEILMKCLRGSTRYMRGVIWAALLKHHPGLTLEAAGRLVDAAGGWPGLAAQLEALNASTQPDNKDVETLQRAGGTRKRPQTARINGPGGRSISPPGALA